MTLPSTVPTRQILTVSRLNQLARTVLESEIGLIWLSGEISNFVSAASGHWYFTLKDNKAQVRAAMFRNTNRTVRQRPKEGDHVLVRASVGIYEPRGDYQLVVEHMESEGEGRLKQQFEALKQKLYAEGLFDTSGKRSLPTIINRIGVITSASGAALHDVLTVLKRRSPATQIIVYPTLVQGQSAAAQIIHTLNLANRRQEVDVLLLTRGGGSLEDLWCFNDERLARAIAASTLPVVSAVGHEVDITIADFVADLRAPTPSAGAELLSQDSAALAKRLTELNVTLLRGWQNRQRHSRHALQLAVQRLHALHPATRIHTQRQTLDRAYTALQQAFNATLSKHRHALERLSSRLSPGELKQRLRSQRQHLERQDKLLAQATQRVIVAKGQKLGAMCHVLQSVSPLATLSRGYSITFVNDRPVMDASMLKKGDVLTTRLSSGEVLSEVLATKRSPDQVKK